MSLLLRVREDALTVDLVELQGLQRAALEQITDDEIELARQLFDGLVRVVVHRTPHRTNVPHAGRDVVEDTRACAVTASTTSLVAHLDGLGSNGFVPQFGHVGTLTLLSNVALH
jgi:hypothetical protein